MDKDQRYSFLLLALLDYDVPSEVLEKIAERWHFDYEEGYDRAATEITLKIQNCIPSRSRTVEEARLQGAWRNAAKIALNHLGKLSNPNYPE